MMKRRFDVSAGGKDREFGLDELGGLAIAELLQESFGMRRMSLTYG